MTAPSEPVLSAKAAQVAFMACTTGEDMREAHRLIKDRALGGVEDEDRLAYLRLFMEYTRGKPRPEPMRALPPVDLGELGTVDECKRAVHLIAEQQFLGHLDDDSAESYRKTVRLALDAIKTGASQQMSEALEGGAVGVFFARADATAEENAEAFLEHQKAQEAAQ